MELEFSTHARERMEQYGVTEEQVYRTVREFDAVKVGVGEASSTNYVKHGVVRDKLSLRVVVDPYKQPQVVSTVHPVDPRKQPRRKRRRNKRRRKA